MPTAALSQGQACGLFAGRGKHGGIQAKPGNDIVSGAKPRWLAQFAEDGPDDDRAEKRNLMEGVPERHLLQQLADTVLEQSEDLIDDVQVAASPGSREAR